MFALAIFLEAGDGGRAYRGIDRRLDDIGFVKKFFVLALRLAGRHQEPASQHDACLQADDGRG